MRSTRWQGAAVGAAAVLALQVAVPSGTVAAQAGDRGRQLAGTWRVVVQPDGAPPSAAFASMLVYTSSGSVVETTSRAPSSAGLGTWDRRGAGRFEVVVEKHRFEGATFAGTTVIRETSQLEPGGARYTGRAVTTVLDAAGRVLRTFTSTATGVRL